MEEFICKYCGRVCKNIYSLRSHEVFCKNNPNRIEPTGHRWTKDERKKIKAWNKGKTAVNKNGVKRYISPPELDEYIKDGWNVGISDEEREAYVEKIKYKHVGRAKDEELERLRKERISLKMLGNKNWEKNKTRGNGKRGWYKGIYCDSSWELAYVVFHVEHNLPIKRSTLRLPFVWEGKTHTYIPDFETNEGIIEIKGRKTKKSLEKQNQYPHIKVIDIDGIKPYLEYVITKYGINFIEVLYD